MISMKDLILDIKIHFRKRMLIRYFIFKHPKVFTAVSIPSVTAVLYYLYKTKPLHLLDNECVYTDKSFRNKDYVIYNSDKSSK
jgi:hypothetical protein